MTTAASVVTAERLQIVEPQEPTQIGELGIDRPAKVLPQARSKTALDVAAEAHLVKARSQHRV